MMRNRLILLFLVAAAVAGTVYSFGYTLSEYEISDDKSTINMPDLKGWPEASQKAAKEMEAKYGKPNAATSDMVVWNNNGPWLKTVVYKKEMKHNFPKPHTDVIGQTINYRVPLNSYDELAMYNGSVSVNRTNGTITARCDNEAMNILSLNLAYDVINNDKNIDRARIEHGKQALAFMNDEKPYYTQKLNFTGDISAPDPDMSLDVVNEIIGMGGGAASPIEHSDKYCAKMKDGNLVVMYEGNVLTSDVTLANGITIKPDGTVMKPDGSRIVLKDGECIDKDGKIIEGRMKEKTKKTSAY